ncbi:MAG: GNAT family N-acetyltransferase [Natronospirillum sp.]
MTALPSSRTTHTSKLPSSNPVRWLRHQTQRISRTLTRLRFVKPLIEPIAVDDILYELALARSLGKTQDGKEILLWSTSRETPLLREIGRLRELSFRAVGEGTGQPLDTDTYDLYYQHLILWDAQTQEIVGAYRFGLGSRIMASRDETAFYSSTLFHFSSAMTGQLSQALELGRSFVQPKYWGSRSLHYLWQGIGAFLRVHPEVRYLFGPVSVSADLPERARALLVAFYTAHFGWQGAPLAEARNPYHIPRKYQRSIEFGGTKLATDYATEFRQLKAELKTMGVAIPTLYKQYSELCEPGGLWFCAYNVDEDFGGCLDGLLWLDITQLKATKYQRYMR